MMHRPVYASALFALILPLGGCDRIEKPTKADCEAAVAQQIRMENITDAPAAEGEKAGGGMLDSLKKGAQKVKAEAMLAASKVEGTFGTRVGACESDWNAHMANCLKAATTNAGATSCGKWF